MTSLNLMFQKYAPCWELSEYSANICVAELCRWCRRDGPQHAAQVEGIITTKWLGSFSPTLRPHYDLPFLVNTVIPGKSFCSASNLCGNKLSVSPQIHLELTAQLMCFTMPFENSFQFSSSPPLPPSLDVCNSGENKALKCNQHYNHTQCRTAKRRNRNWSFPCIPSLVLNTYLDVLNRYIGQSNSSLYLDVTYIVKKIFLYS